MDSCLEDLFQHIAETEKHAEDRKKQLSRVRQKLSDCSSKRKEVECEYQSCLKQLNSKIDEQIDAKMQEQVFVGRADALQTERDKLLAKRNDLQSDLEALHKTIESMRRQFACQVKDFDHGYGLSSSGLQQREQRARQEIEDACKSQLKLQKELQELKNRKIEKNNLIKNSDIAEQKRIHLLDLQQQHAALVAVTRKLESQKSKVTESSHNDSELQSLQNEIDANQSVTLESKCQVLRIQLQQLRRQQWLKQQKRRMKAEHI